LLPIMTGRVAPSLGRARRDTQRCIFALDA
jgi:hypothetical protein